MAPTNSVVVATTPVSKLRPPRVRHAEVTRTRLLQQDLDACEVLVICAPAGYGKSTLAIQWASRTGRPVAWATVDETDNDPVVLLATVSAALGHAVDDFVPPAVFTAEEPAYSRQVLPGFIAAVAAIAEPVSVVIDDVHLLNQASRTVLKVLVDALPPGSQAAFVGRSMTAIPLPLWRGQGRVAQLDAAALAFRPEETDEAVRSFHGQPDAVAVHEATGGWPVAVFLLSQATSGQSITDVAEFIESEVLAPMPDTLRDFVLDTAPVGSVNTSLGERLSGSQRAGQFLAEGITTVLLAPTEDDWHHYHPLLQDCVIDLLKREDPQRLRRTYANAAQWQLEHGFWDNAVRFALASEDPTTMGHVVWPATVLALLHGRASTVQGWMQRIGDRRIHQQPELSMASTWTNVVTGDYGRVLRDAEQTLRLMPDDWRLHPADFSVGPQLTLLMAITHFGTGGVDEALRLAHQARGCLDAHSPLLPLATMVLGLNQALVGDISAELTLRQAVALAEVEAIASTHTEALSTLSLLLIASGRETAGCDLASEAANLYTFHELREMTSTSGLLAVAKVALACYRGSDAEVRRAIADHARVSQEIEKIFFWFRPLSGGVLAYASIRLGDHDAYHRYLQWCDGVGLCQQWSTKAQQAYAAATPLSRLTPAELRVWDLLKGRMTLSEIAGALFLSRETVKSHTGSIYRKLGVASRREAQELAETWR